ncbi:MAG: hypothetical protein ACLPPF_15815 [Rhodomicrobium sp.]
MPDSWRNILERAASNLTIDLDQRPSSSLRQQPAAWPSPTPVPARPASNPRSFVESRDLLARELESISGQSLSNAPARGQTQSGRALVPVRAQRPSMNKAVKPATRKFSHAACANGGSLRSLTALAVSVAIVVLSVYGIFALLQ